MQEQGYQSASTLTLGELGSTQQQEDVEQTAKSYRAPHLLVIGKTTDLMQGLLNGQYYEGGYIADWYDVW